MKKTFLNINRDECKQASIDTLKNANKQFEVGEKLNEFGEYGSAVSHVIIGSEELVKALILHLDSVGFRFRSVKGVKSIFINHQLRYFVSFIMFIFSTLSDELTRTFKKIGNGQINITQIEEFNNKMNDNPKNEEFKLNIVLYFLSKAESIFEEISWFRGFDLFRQQGFYVDFDNEIKSPLQCTEQDYISIKSKVNKVNESVNDIIKSVNNDTKENRDLLDSLLKRLNTDKVYASMSRFIDNVKQHKTNALDYAYDSISPFIQDFKGELNK